MFDIIYSSEPLLATYEIGLAISTFNRPNYLKTFLASLQQSLLENVVIVMVDDGSFIGQTCELVKSFSIPGVPVIKALKPRWQGFGVHENLQTGWDLLIDRLNCHYLCNLDSDTLVRTNWLSRIRELYLRERPKRGPILVTGFNASRHVVLSEGDDFYVKETIGGLNMFFDRALYRELVRSSLRYEKDREVGWDWFVVEAMQREKYPFLCTKPSVVQHIGKLGRFSNPTSGYDVALDY